MKVFGKISVFILILTAMTAAGVFSSSAVSAKRPAAYIKSAGVIVRASASVSSKAIAKSSKKTKVALLSGKKFNKHWYKIKLKSGKKGYVHKNHLSIPKNQLYITPSATVYVGYRAKFNSLINTTGSSVKWKSSDKASASVDSNGVITPLKAGKVTIKAKAGSRLVKSALTVKNADVKLSMNSASMLTEDKLTLKASCKKSVSWTSSDSSVASVKNGVITAQKVGKAVITAQSKSGKASCAVEVKKRIITLSSDKTTAYVGCRIKLTPSGGAHGYTYTSSKPDVFTVDKNGFATALSKGESEITCKSGDLTAKITLKAKTGDAVKISNDSAEIKSGMTYFVRSQTSSVKWKTSDSSVATVSGGYIKAKNLGTAIITAYTQSGASDCVVEVKPAQAVRFCYTSENSPQKGQKIAFYAITDSLRTSLKFKITPPSGAKYWLKPTVKSASGSRIIWKAVKTLSVAGTYKVNAYSKTGSTSFSTSDGGFTTVFVNSTSDRKQSTTSEKRASTALLKDIASFEGYVPKVEEDPLVANSPTVGYGHVVYAGTSFYNNMTKREAFAFLVNSINDMGYNSRVNQILKENQISCNQQQFDALVCFSYNLGIYAITNHENLIGTLQNSYGKEKYKDTGYISGYDVYLRESASDSSEALKKLSAGSYVTVTGTSGSWKKVLLSDKKTEGFIKKSQLVMRTTDESKRNLNNVPLSAFKNFLNYHHASGNCIKGLLYRRVDELEMFMFDDYVCDGKENKYGLSYKCSKNSDFTL